MMHVPFIDLQKLNARYAIPEAIARVLNSGRYLFGAEVEAFEREFASYTGTAHCVALANGLDALRLTLGAWVSLGTLAAGDEVIVPANSFVASALAVTESGLRVRFADVNPLTFNVTIETIDAAMSHRTRAVMPVHLYGQLADIERVRSFCLSKDLLVIEDAAQAHGARTANGCAGAIGDAGAFSFYPTKNLGALGDAGCMVTNDPVLAERVRALANYGSSSKYRHEFLGANSRMDELQAAILQLKLTYLDRDNKRRRVIAERYRNAIRSPFISLPTEPVEPSSHVWHIFAITASKREGLVRYLETKGIQSNVHYPCTIHQQPAYLASSGVVDAPVSERLQHEVLSLPISPVMDEKQIEYVIDAVNNWPGPLEAVREGMQ